MNDSLVIGDAIKLFIRARQDDHTSGGRLIQQTKIRQDNAVVAVRMRKLRNSSSDP